MLPTIAYECSEFLKESGGKPLLKNLPKYSEGFIRVKVRTKKMTDDFIENFNLAFADEKPKLLQRAVFVQGESRFTPSTNSSFEPFYIFPIDGYKYMYNPHIHTTDDYTHTFNTIINEVGVDALELFRKMLKYDYTFDKLEHGITSGSEIIIYDIPYYFALRKSIIDDYDSFYNG